MPKKEYNSKADYDEEYRFLPETDGHPSSRPPIRLGYCRWGMLQVCERRADALLSIFNWYTDIRIVIFGAGYSFLAEVLESRGYTNVVGVDTGLYVQGTKDLSEEFDVNAAIQAAGLSPVSGRGAEIKGRVFSPGARCRASRGVHNEDLSTGGSRNRVKNAIGGSVDVIFSEDLLPCLEDNEAVIASGWANQLTSEVVHFVHCIDEIGEPDLTIDLNWKTLEEWKALIPADTFIAAGTYRML
jgi:hypothetical protein